MLAYKPSCDIPYFKNEYIFLPKTFYLHTQVSVITFSWISIANENYDNEKWKAIWYAERCDQKLIFHFISLKQDPQSFLARPKQRCRDILVRKVLYLPDMLANSINMKIVFQFSISVDNDKIPGGPEKAACVDLLPAPFPRYTCSFRLHSSSFTFHEYAIRIRGQMNNF